MLCAQVCRAYGADRIIISDLYNQRLKRALHVTADIGVNASTEDVVRRIREDSDEGGAMSVWNAPVRPLPSAPVKKSFVAEEDSWFWGIIRHRYH